MSQRSNFLCNMPNTHSSTSCMSSVKNSSAFFFIALSAICSAESPNFIVILTDDQSWVGSSVLMNPDDSRTRSDFYMTPHMERLAHMGMRFTQGYSPASSCCPTRRAIQTGQFPARHEYNADRKGRTSLCEAGWILKTG